jgi:hypothetical protein
LAEARRLAYRLTRRRVESTQLPPNSEFALRVLRNEGCRPSSQADRPARPDIAGGIIGVRRST